MPEEYIKRFTGDNEMPNDSRAFIQQRIRQQL